jgi:hypothetical protein
VTVTWRCGGAVTKIFALAVMHFPLSPRDCFLLQRDDKAPLNYWMYPRRESVRFPAFYGGYMQMASTTLYLHHFDLSTGFFSGRYHCQAAQCRDTLSLDELITYFVMVLQLCS